MKFSENEQPKKELKKLNHEVEKLESEVEEIDEKIGLKTDKVAERTQAKIEKVDDKVEGVKSDIKEIKSDVRDLSKATKTLFKIFTRSHDYLLNHYIWYYNWHTNKASSPTHWAALLLSIILLVYIFGFQLGFFGGQKPVVSAGTGINKMINYQGKLTDTNDIPVADAAYNMKFSIYSDAAGTTRIWTCAGTLVTPTAISVTVANGIFSVGLGATGDCTNALDLDFNTDEYYLGVTVGADSEMTPRKRIGAVGYAYNSDTVDGFHAASTATANYLLVLDAGGGITFDNGADRTIGITADTTGNSLILQGGEGTAGNGGDINLKGGVSAGGAPGNIVFTTANIEVARFDTLNLVFNSNDNHQIQINDSPPATAGYSLTVKAGNATGVGDLNGGSLFLQPGALSGAGKDGVIVFNDALGDEVAEFTNRDLVFIASDNHVIMVSDNVDASGKDITIQAGNATGAGVLSGGDIFLFGGAQIGGGTDGDIILAHTGAAALGKVGIGDSSPAALLTVGNGDLFQVAGATGSVTINNAGDTGSISIEGTNLDINSLDFVGAGTISTGAASTLTLDSGTTGAINLGTAAAAKTITIGNETSTSSLELDSGTGAINIGNAIAKTITIGNITGATAVNLNTGTGGSTITTTGAGDFTVSSGDRVIINSAKAAGGTTTEAISIKSTINLGASDELLQIGDTADMMTILGNGNVGIGTATPSGLLDLSSSTSGADETPYRTVGGASIPGAGDYNLGYKFTAKASGQITALAARVHDTNSSTIRLYDSAGTVLASATVTGVVDTWVSASITPVSVTAGSWYVVAVRTSNFTYSANSLPVSTNNIIINEGRYLAAVDTIPTTAATANIYGADITFVKNPPNSVLLVADDGNVGIGGVAPDDWQFYVKQADSIATSSAAIYAANTNNASIVLETNSGVVGVAQGTGYKNYGIYGYATGATNNYGIYGDGSGSGTAYAGYFTGNVYITGSGYLGGAAQGNWDLAEMTPFAGVEPQAAEIVSFAANQKESIQKTSKAYDNNLAGVVSTNPSTAMGVRPEDGSWQKAVERLDEVPVTLSGRVPVKVTNENGSIKVGDKLTSSSTPGYAMKATKAGMIVGIAMEDFNGEAGVITVFVNLFYYNPNTEEGLQGSTILTVENINSLDDKDVVIEPGSGKTKIVGELTVNNKLIVEKDIEVKGHIIGNHDTRGVITISAGATEAEFVFDTPYLFEPSVVATQKITCSEKAEGKVCGAMIDEGYAVEVYQDKFIVHIPQELDYDVTFSWMAEQ